MVTLEHRLKRVQTQFRSDVSLSEQVDGRELVWTMHNPRKNPLPVISLYDPRTDITLSRPLLNRHVRIEAYDGWSMVRHSRAPGYTHEIVDEMGLKGVDPNEKLDRTFAKLSHAAVANLAKIRVDANNAPMHMAMMTFNLAQLGKGQEKSTRFQQDFRSSHFHGLRHYVPPELELELSQRGFTEEYARLGTEAQKAFAESFMRVNNALQKVFPPSNKHEQGTIDVRALDIARAHLLFGHSTGFAFKTDARTHSQYIAHLRASPVPMYRDLADQWQRFLVPSAEVEYALRFVAEAPGLVRHADADPTINNNLEQLARFLENSSLHGAAPTVLDKPRLREQRVESLPVKMTAGERTIAQYITAIWPGKDFKRVLRWVHQQSDSDKRKLSTIVYDGHGPHHEMGEMGTATDLTLLVEQPLSLQRDLNRHQQWGRYIQGLPIVHGLPLDYSGAQQVIGLGFGLSPMLEEIPELGKVRQRMIDALKDHYDRSFEFMERVNTSYGADIDLSFIFGLLPLAHRTPMNMHGVPAGASYMPALRHKPGGDIGYRITAHDAANLLADEDPTLEGVRINKPRPDPTSREEFFDRS